MNERERLTLLMIRSKKTNFHNNTNNHPDGERVQATASPISSVIAGIRWLLALQNWDGGIPTFCQGWGMLPFDQSSTDITAHVIRAFQVWRKKLDGRQQTADGRRIDLLKNKMLRAEERMFAFLERTQQKNGSWFPLWFGNQTMPDDVNPYYGTAKVLLALAETKKEHAMTFNGLRYLIASQNVDGSWGNSVEETAVVVEALSAHMGATSVIPAKAGIQTLDVNINSLDHRLRGGDEKDVSSAYHRGLHWLVEAVESDRFLEASPIGLYFAKLWYYEDLYPIIFTASALRRHVAGTLPTK